MAPAGGGSTGRVSDRHERALKVSPPLTAGELTRVARAANGAEAELIQALLLERGVPSLLRRSAGFDVPDFLAAGPRDVLVPAAAADRARELLAPAAEAGQPAPGRPSTEAVVSPGRLLAGLLAALALGLLVVWIVTLAVR